MEFTEKNIEQIKHVLMTVIARFTSDVTAISIEPKKTFIGTEYLDIETNNIRMSPCLFKSLCIQGEATPCQRVDESEYLYIVLTWRWKSFGGGSNGTEFAIVWMQQNFDGGYSVTDIRF